MKKFYIFLSIIITLWFFLPFIDKYSLFQIHDLIKNNTYIDIDTSKVLKAVFIFIISSWFISLWYNKKVKISIIGLIWAWIYLFYYYKIFWFIFDSKDNIQKWFEYWNMLLWKENTIDIIFNVISESKNHLWVWFYMILWWFILNSLAIINIFKNLILLSSWNYKEKEEKDNNNSLNIYIEKIKTKINDENFKKFLIKVWFGIITIIFLINSIINPFIKVDNLSWWNIWFFSWFIKWELISDYSMLISYTISYISIFLLSILSIAILINFIKKWTIKVFNRIENYNLIILIINLIIIFMLNIYINSWIVKFLWWI